MALGFVPGESPLMQIRYLINKGTVTNENGSVETKNMLDCLPKVKGCSQILQEIASLRQYIVKGFIQGEYKMNNDLVADKANISFLFSFTTGAEAAINIYREPNTSVVYTVNGNKVDTKTLSQSINNLKATANKVDTNALTADDMLLILSSFDDAEHMGYYWSMRTPITVNFAKQMLLEGRSSYVDCQIKYGIDVAITKENMQTIKIVVSHMDEGITPSTKYNHTKTKTYYCPGDIKWEQMESFLAKYQVYGSIKEKNKPGYVSGNVRRALFEQRLQKDGLSVQDAWKLAAKCVDRNKPGANIQDNKIVFYADKEKGARFEALLENNTLIFNVWQPKQGFSVMKHAPAWLQNKYSRTEDANFYKETINFGNSGFVPEDIYTAMLKYFLVIY